MVMRMRRGMRRQVRRAQQRRRVVRWRRRPPARALQAHTTIAALEQTNPVMSNIKQDLTAIPLSITKTNLILLIVTNLPYILNCNIHIHT